MASMGERREFFMLILKLLFFFLHKKILRNIMGVVKINIKLFKKIYYEYKFQGIIVFIIKFVNLFTDEMK